jgi:hypothetical protein
MKYKNNEEQRHLRVYENRSEYHAGDGDLETFQEGAISKEARKRIKMVKDAFENGFLGSLIDGLLTGTDHANMADLSTEAKKCVNGLVDSLTSEVGRALIGLSVMQLCVKSITPEQNIRLHKGSSNRASFSWVEGISMRTLDKKYVTPTLRKQELLRLNADGFMMTRSLAENYPYTFLYKANLKGARTEWLALVEEIEEGRTSTIETLKYLLSRLIHAASEFSSEADTLLEQSKKYVSKCFDREVTRSILVKHSEQSDYAARLLEINMHALMQAAVASGAFGDMEVKPLSQMRSANKKHGNIGDIELLEDGQIIEAWDAKYGKSYLREELEEVIEKFQNHDFVKMVGFVTNTEITRVPEIEKRIDEIDQLYSICLKILSYKDWVNYIYERVLATEMISEQALSQNWFSTYCEYLSQKRRDVAPIDEPCLDWVRSLRRIIEENA